LNRWGFRNWFFSAETKIKINDNSTKTSLAQNR
jgi:hypothetical protein